jgi:hypothetical protein
MLYGNSLLNFRDFKRYQNSFRGHFVGEVGKHVVGDAYRENPSYKKCMAAHPAEFGKLAEELRGRSDHDSLEYLKKLYEAYVMMHPYADTNWEMFQ